MTKQDRITIAATLLIAINLPAAAEMLNGVVIKVSDGDTLKLQTHEACTGNRDCQKGLRVYRIRLSSIDAPESSQPYGAQSASALYRMVAWQPLQVDVQDKDRYGRLVGDVYVDGQLVNEEMVRGGYAWVYQQYNRHPELLDLEQKARAAKAGLWALPQQEQMPPWEWRKKHKGKQ